MPRLLSYRLVLAAFSLVFCLGACGREDGGMLHAGERSLVPADRAYRLWYLSPPWRLVSETSGQAVLEVWVDWLNNFVPDAGRTPGVTRLTVSVMPSEAMEAVIARWVAGAGARKTTIVYPSRSIKLGAGASGLEAADRMGAAGTQRVVATKLADGRIVVLLFQSFLDITQDLDIAHMVSNFEPRPPTDVER